MIVIHFPHSDKTLEINIPEGAELRRQLMGEHFVKMSFCNLAKVAMPIGTWCEVEGYGRFALTTGYEPRYDASTGGFVYDLQFDADYMWWRNHLVMYRPSSVASETAFHLTTSLTNHLSLVVGNINAVGARDVTLLPYGNYSLEFIGDVAVASEHKYIGYSSTDILSALTTICQTYDVEWWVKDATIYIGKCLVGETLDLRLGDNVEEWSRSQSEKTYANRLYAFGSTRNIPSAYRRVLDNPFHINETVYVQGQVLRFAVAGLGTTTTIEPLYPFTEYFSPTSKVELIGGTLDGHIFSFTVVSGTYIIPGARQQDTWVNPLFEITLNGYVRSDSWQTFRFVRFINDAEHGNVSQCTVSYFTDRRFTAFTFSDLKLASEAIRDTSTIIIGDEEYAFRLLPYDKDVTGAYLASNHNMVYAASVGDRYADLGDIAGSEATIVGLNMSYVSELYTSSSLDNNDAVNTGVAERRLMLAGLPYVQTSPDLAESDVVEAVLVDDSIYPHVDCIVGEVMTYISTAKDADTGEEVTSTYYRVTDKGGFECPISIQIGREPIHIVFTSGSMNGMDFECNYNEKEKCYEITQNESYQRPLPDPALHPVKGDHFVIYGWDSSLAEDTNIIDAAEQQLREKAVAALEEMQKPSVTDTLRLSSRYCYTVGFHPVLGQPVAMFTDTTTQTATVSRVIGFTIKLDIPYDSLQLTIGEAPQSSILKDLQKQIDAISLNGQSIANVSSSSHASLPILATGSTKEATDSNVYSALRSQGEFVSKTHDDSVQGNISFEQDINVEGGVVAGSLTSMGDSHTAGNSDTLGKTSTGSLDVAGSSTFGGDVRTPDFTSGLYDGRGWRIDGQGNAELESIRIRSYLEVVELLINRLQAQEGDTLFSDNDQIIQVGTIDTEELADEDTPANPVYLLTLKEKWDGYVTSQQYGNILKGIVNTLAAREAGLATAEESAMVERDGVNSYFTSWMRVIATHATDVTLGVNQIRVVLYGDNDVPAGRNFAPCALMNVARWGCVDYSVTYPEGAERERVQESIKRRQQVFYISTTDGRITKLRGVDKPILSEGNYGTTVGTLPDFLYEYPKVRERAISGRDYLYAQGVVVGDFIQVDTEGQPIPTVVFVGDWKEGQEYLYNEFSKEQQRHVTHEVRHRNARWQCLQHQPVVSGGVSTYHEPRWGSPYWVMVDGDESYTIEFASSRGYTFRRGTVDTVITPHIFYGKVDITDDIAAEHFIWTRHEEANADNGDDIFTQSDLTWNAQHTGLLIGKTLHLTNNDMPQGWSSQNRSVFTLTVSIDDGKTTHTVNNYITT